MLVSNERGNAIFETLPIMIVMILFVNFSLGFFGAIHSGILGSIAARNYAFETFRHRSNLVYFRNTPIADTKHVCTPGQGNGTDPTCMEFSSMQNRVHGSVSETAKTGGNTWIATTRLIDFMNFEHRAADQTGTKNDHVSGTKSVADGVRFTGNGVNPIWVKISYGICLSAGCGT
jgi:hypothetical protein